MQKVWRGLTGGVLICVIASCASGNPLKTSTEAEKQKQVAQPKAAQEAPQISKLSTNNLPDGKCGTLLWTLESGKPVMVFRAVKDEGAEMMIDGTPTVLILQSQSGEQRYGMATEQRYATDTGIQVSISGRYSSAFKGGTYIEEGLMTLTNPEGWERVNPVAGLAGCRS